MMDVIGTIVEVKEPYKGYKSTIRKAIVKQVNGEKIAISFYGKNKTTSLINYLNKKVLINCISVVLPLKNKDVSNIFKAKKIKTL